MFCMHCGNNLKEGSKFCARCGKPVEQSWQEPAPQPTPAQPEYYQPAPQQVPTQQVPVQQPVAPVQQAKPVSKKGKVFAILGLVFGIIVFLASIGIDAAYYVIDEYIYQLGTEAEYIAYNEQSWMFAYALYGVAVCALMPLGFSLTGLIVSIGENKKGFNAKKTLIISIIALSLSALALTGAISNGGTIMSFVNLF